MNDLDALVKISKYAGERFDLVQAGGGNSSVKLDDGTMLIKASGFLLSDVEKDNGYSKVVTKDITCIVKNEQLLRVGNKREREALTASLVKSATVDKVNRPSIETLLHSFMLKYTLHTHPIVVNMIVIQQNWKELLQQLFNEEKIALVDYQTPGIELAFALDREINQHQTTPKIIFLQNHGLIITSDDVDEIESLTEHVLTKIEKYLDIDMNRYKMTSKISKVVNSISNQKNTAYLSEDTVINKILFTSKELFFMRPFCPDMLVYCGIHAIEFNDLDETKELKKYFDKYFEMPKVLIFQDQIFVISKNIKKAKEIEEVLKFHIIVLEQNLQINIEFLEMNELAYLSNWEAEKYRQEL